MRPAAALAGRLGLPVGDLDLLEQALVHSSWLHEHPDAARGHNERLEFLGDAVVNLAMSEALFTRHPDDDEGLLSARRATIVDTRGLARLAARIELGRHLQLGEGEDQRGGRSRPSLLASAFEALVGALYLDVGYAGTRDWLVELAAPALDAAGAAPALLKSPKSRLQELTQRRTGARPEYRLIEAMGPDHEKTFRVEVAVEGEIVGSGEGPSRRVAETAAAAVALERLWAARLRRGTRGLERSDADETARSEAAGGSAAGGGLAAGLPSEIALSADATRPALDQIASGPARRPRRPRSLRRTTGDAEASA